MALAGLAGLGLQRRRVFAQPVGSEPLLVSSGLLSVSQASAPCTGSWSRHLHLAPRPIPRFILSPHPWEGPGGGCVSVLQRGKPRPREAVGLARATSLTPGPASDSQPAVLPRAPWRCHLQGARSPLSQEAGTADSQAGSGCSPESRHVGPEQWGSRFWWKCRNGGQHLQSS